MLHKKVVDLQCRPVAYWTDRALSYGDKPSPQAASAAADGKPAVLTDVVDGSVWKKHMSHNNGAACTDIGIVCGVDGFSPFHGKQDKGTKLMPCKVSCLNLHPSIRNETHAQWLPFILQGQAEPNPNFACEVMADELAWAHYFGFDIKEDASNPGLGGFNCKVKLLLLRADYRGFQKLLRRAGTPAATGACYKCDVTGLTQSTTGMDKTIYGGEAPHHANHHVPAFV